MKLRSLLFVPGDRPDRMRKALDSGADAIVIDLEDSVRPPAKPLARDNGRTFLESDGAGGVAVWVRVNAVGTEEHAQDVAALSMPRLAGVVLPKAEGAESIRHAAAGLGPGTPIIPVVTETPRSIFRIGEYAECASGLGALTWGAEDLSSAVGATTPREADGRLRSPYELARYLTDFGANAAGVPAIETIFPDVDDKTALGACARRAREDGFGGMFAIHPSQVEVINEAFRPSPAEIDHAHRVIEAFRRVDGAGAVALDGVMLDAPHLALAHRLVVSSKD